MTNRMRVACWLVAALAVPHRASADAVAGQRTFYLFGPPAAQSPAAILRPPPVAAAPLATSGAEQCRAAGRLAGREAGIPDHLMAAIARVESGRPDGHGATAPWPWSINVEGVDHVYPTKADAVAAVRGFQVRGSRSIDVGCMQVNLMYHPRAFTSLEDGFDPAANAGYAARFLVRLRNETGSWERAVAAYHSGNPELGEPYRRKVMAALPEEQRIAGAAGLIAGLPAAGGGAVGGGPPRATVFAANDGQQARILALPTNGAAGRDLAAYRSAPILVASPFARRAPQS